MTQPDIEAVLRELQQRASRQYRADMAGRYGITTRARVLGTPVSTLRAMARRLGKDHALAEDLWQSGVHDARMLATMIEDPARVSRSQMNRWARDFDNWALVDTACFNLFDRVPQAFAQIDKWSAARDEFVKRAAFALLASCALHGHGAESQLQHGLQLIERESHDGRNFVRKGMSWALRAVGGREEPALRQAARDLAGRLAASADASERWVGKDALKALRKIRS